MLRIMKKSDMMKNNNLITIIPARMDSVRLPNKPMKIIAGKPMIVHVWKQAMAAKLGPVLVACDNISIMNAIQDEGGIAMLTDSKLASGSDRIYAALCEFDPDETYRRVINLQGDLPDIPPNYLALLANMMRTEASDLCTLVAPCEEKEITAQQVVKAVVSWDTKNLNSGFPIGRAHYFSRAPIPFGSEIFWHHIGIYGWQRVALKKFVESDPSTLEKTEKLEQLRALELGMIIAAGKVDTPTIGVDTEEDLINIQKKFKSKNEV